MTLDKRKDYLTIIIGLLAGFKFRFIGTFYASEILILFICFFIPWKPLFSNRYASNIFKLTILWLFSCVITDIYVGSSPLDSMKGAFNLIFFIFQFPVIYWLISDKPRRFLYYLIAYGIMSLPCFFMFGPTINDEDSGIMGENIWLYYSMVPLAVGVISWLYYKHKIGYRLCSLMMVGFGFFMLFHNSRNVFLTMSMAAVLLYQIDKYNGDLQQFRRHIPATVMILMIGAIAINFSYSYLASNGILGEYAYNKYMAQSKADNIIEGGRGETILGIELIKKSPILGYGSFAMDKGDAFHKAYAKAAGKKYVRPIIERRMPGHSYIVGAWMQNGIGGGIFWLYILILMWKYFKSGAITRGNALLPAILMTFTATFWDILFSPFGLRIPVAFFLMYLSTVYSQYRNNHNLTYA